MIIALSIYLAVLLWMAVEVRRAPLGYENSTGYHDGREP
jgi:hypothetical protein